MKNHIAVAAVVLLTKKLIVQVLKQVYDGIVFYHLLSIPSCKNHMIVDEHSHVRMNLLHKRIALFDCLLSTKFHPLHEYKITTMVYGCESIVYQR